MADFSEDDVLVEVGWTAAVAASFELNAPEGTVPGRVSRADRGEAIVVGSGGPRRVASDAQRSQDDVAPATGDWVAVGRRPGLGEVIEMVLPRKTEIVRRDPSEQVIEQVLVANADIVAAVHGLDRPVNLGRIERFLILAADSGAEPVVVLTKTDLVTAEELAAALVAVEPVSHGVPVIAASATGGQGLDALHELVADNATVVFLGASGVGKSSLVNALVGSDVQAVNEVRSGDAKGRHTTTTRELIPIPGGGVVVDTPGVRAIGVWDADEAIDAVYSEIADIAAGCRFRDCTHREEPGCAVRSAVSEGRLDPARVERYQRLWQEVAEQAEAREERGRRQHRGRKSR